MKVQDSDWGQDEPRDIWRELAEAALRDLDGRRFGLYAPTAGPLGLEPPWLAATERQNDVLVKVVLGHGSLFAAEGPYLAVETAAAEAAESAVCYPLSEVVEDERDRLFDHAGIDEDGSGGEGVESEPSISVDGVPVRALLRVEGGLWAARLHLDGVEPPSAGVPLTLTLTGRGVPPDRIELHTVEELAPYAVGRRRNLAALAARTEPRTDVRERELPPAAGLDAHRRLVEHSVLETLAIEAAVRSGARPRRPRSGRVDEALLWESAVRQQMRLAGEDRDTANEAVTILVNQMTLLAQRVDWFPGSPGAASAVEESIRHTVFDSAVPSVEAQLAWRAEWLRRTAWHGRQRHGDPESIRGRVRERVDAEARWLGLWQSWYERSLRNNS
ncbi:hypothetical protein GXW83_25655 [Streptacidiphilus sp. PB12-B1b]|uniref:hypothetical protein n=1 Tax=Streptacidiphilus sp. PB12-B1b TaxID=2705012 RepID=UPI0015FA50C5|nr:hypothetical protein [Streptacidiphilus sp. PB12-B1b]QMU78588.1 hypothetical protein GXW83_25655 [Streptacidiphilus sp. PB12-B1b]